MIEIIQRGIENNSSKKSIAAKEIIQKHNKAFGGSLNNAETIRQTGVSKKTFYKYKRELLSSQSL